MYSYGKMLPPGNGGGRRGKKSCDRDLAVPTF